MKRLVWLASYPKSGNTWIRALLSAYFCPAHDAFDLNRLAASGHAADREVFDRIAGISASELTTAQIDRLRPEVYATINAEQTDPLFLKTHDRWRRNDQGLSVFPAPSSLIVILIVRNPLSIAASFANHFGESIDRAIEIMADDTLVTSTSDVGLKWQLHQPLGSWSSHAASWLDQSEIPLHLVRYEDLQNDPVETFAGLLRAAQFTPDQHRLDSAVELTRFERLQSFESTHGFRERSRRSVRFFRTGATDSWRQELSPAQQGRIVHSHLPMMRRLGYVGLDA